MSGSGGSQFPRGLGNWALRYAGRGNDDDGDDDNDGDNNENNDQTNEEAMNSEPLSPEALRAQRLQRMEQQQSAAAPATGAAEATAMEVDSPKASTSTAPAAKKAPPAPSQKAPPASAAPPNNEGNKKKRKSNEAGGMKDNESRKTLRKKELLFRKVLNISVAASSSDSNLVHIPLEAPEISVQTVAEVLSSRVSMATSDLPKSSSLSSNSSLIAYLGDCHRKATEELKSLSRSSGGSSLLTSSSSKQQTNEELMELLQEIQKQVVSYAATVLMEPDLFELGKDSTMQLAQCIQHSINDLTSSITFGVNGSSSSFYMRLMEELVQQDEDSLTQVITKIAQHFQTQLSKCESVLDNAVAADGASSSFLWVSALAALCMHKKAAEIVSQMDGFLLPPPDSPAAQTMVSPSPPPSMGAGGNRFLQQFMAGLALSYKRRSGPGLEKGTLLGACLRVGVPKNNAAFSPSSILRQSLAAVESATSQQRQQLNLHHEACHQLLHQLVKSPKARAGVLKWFTDALLVNVGADASRPDPSKVSSSNLLLNLSVVLLKLCQPFIRDPKKHSLVDFGFLDAPSAHSGVYVTSGDNAVPRLGEQQTDSMDVEYNPKNAFVSQLFFLTARSIHFGMAALLRQHESLLRQLSHLHWMITSRPDGDLQSDPHFAVYVSRQRSSEVALFDENMVSETVEFLQMAARLLNDMDDALLPRMPEDFINDICHVITSLAKVKPKLLRSIDVAPTFRLVVKLLSPKYASMVRNYNLRAMLGDVLYELFLPPAEPSDRRDVVPSSVYMDPFTGRTYLLADQVAQQSLAPSLLLLYGEVEHTGYYDKMSHRAKISSLIKYLWESAEHRPAFRRITQNRDSFIKFANGIMNETNTLIATVMQKLPEIREAQLKRKNPQQWAALTEEQQTQITERLEENEREVKHALPLCNKTLQMFGYLNTDEDIRNLFLLDELCSRLVTMLLHVLTKLVGTKGLELKVDNPDELEFKPKFMLRDLCYIFSLFGKAPEFQLECAKSGCDAGLLRMAYKTVDKLNLLQGETLVAFRELPDLVDAAVQRVSEEEALLSNAPDEFLDEILSTFMKDPVILPSGHYVDRKTITQHLLNDPTDPFNRAPMTLSDVKPATELAARMQVWLEEQRAGKQG